MRPTNQGGRTCQSCRHRPRRPSHRPSRRRQRRWKMGGGRWGQRRLWQRRLDQREGGRTPTTLPGTLTRTTMMTPSGGGGARLRPRGNAGGEWRRRRRRRTMTRGWRAVTMTVGRARMARGGRSTTPFLVLRWHGMTAGQRQHQQRHTTIK